MSPDRFLRSLPYAVSSVLVNVYGLVLRRQRFSPPYDRIRAWLGETQFWKDAEWAEWQTRQLRWVLDRAKGAPYYQKLFEKVGVDPANIHSLQDLSRIPVLTKDSIRSEFQQLKHRDLRRMRPLHRSSSGTTGEKLWFYLPRVLGYTLNAAITWRQYSWLGVEHLERRVTLGGRMFTERPPYYIHNRSENQLLLSIHHLNQHTAEGYIEVMKRFGPAFIQGQPNGLEYLSQHMLASRTRVRVKGVFTTGETLDARQRWTIQEAFEAPVLQSYGMGENVIAAQECERADGFHDVLELGVTELCRLEHSESQYLIGTSLWNDAMPFIRYVIPDLVTPAEVSKCLCGRSLPLRFKAIAGRVDDRIQDASGVMVFPVTVRMAVKPLLNAFESYQLQQTGRGRYRLLIVGGLDEARAGRFRAALTGVLGAGSRVEVEPTEKLLTSGGKIRNVIDLSRASGDGT